MTVPDEILFGPASASVVVLTNALEAVGRALAPTREKLDSALAGLGCGDPAPPSSPAGSPEPTATAETGKGVATRRSRLRAVGSPDNEGGGSA